MFLAMPEQWAIDRSFDIRGLHPFEDIRHVAYLHAVDSIDGRDAIDARGAGLLDVDDDPMQNGFGGGQFTAFVHPRWCPKCVVRRTALLNQGLATRLAKINPFTDNEAVRRNEKAYVLGVFQDRVYALTAPLEENEQAECADLEPGIDDVVDMLLEDHLTEGEEGIEEPAADLGNGGMQNLTDKMFGARLAEGDSCWRHSWISAEWGTKR
jgi:hypothetical protein